MFAKSIKSKSKENRAGIRNIIFHIAKTIRKDRIGEQIKKPRSKKTAQEMPDYLK